MNHQRGQGFFGSAVVQRPPYGLLGPRPRGGQQPMHRPPNAGFQSPPGPQFGRRGPASPWPWRQQQSFRSDFSAQFAEGNPDLRGPQTQAKLKRKKGSKGGHGDPKRLKGGTSDSDVEVICELPPSPNCNRNLFLQDPLLPSHQRVLALLALVDRFAPRIPDWWNLPRGGDSNENLSGEIWDFFKTRTQSAGRFEQKIRLWSALDEVFGKRYNSSTMAFGSTLNGFGNDSCDMDLGLFSDYAEKVSNGSSRGRKRGDVEFLAEIRKLLRRECGNYIRGNIELIPAKVPILKFFDSHGNLEVDLSCNSHAGAINTHLLFCYSQAIKAWAKSRDINDAKSSTFSSYTLTLLVLNFLQCGVTPPVLPSVQAMFPKMFQPEADVFTLPYLNPLPSFRSKNKNSLGDLFIAFFTHYDRFFDFAQDVASIRLGRLLTNRECEDFAREHRLCPRQWTAYVCCEEPLDRTNAGRAIVKREQFDVILEAFRQSARMLARGKVSLSAFLGD